MFRGLFSIVITAWRSIAFVGTVVGILYLWPDLKGLPSQYGYRWGQFMPDRDAVALAFLGLTLLWIVWMDARPAARRWWRSLRKPPLQIEFPDLVNHIGKYGPNKRSTYYLNMEKGHNGRFTRSMYYVDVTNTTNRTIKNVSVHLHEVKSGAGWFPERRLVTQSGAVETDIRPGQTEYFLLGFRDSPEMNAEHVAPVDGAQFRRLEAEWQCRGSKHLGFMMVVEDGGRIPLLKNNGAGFVLGIYAEDLSPSRHLFVLNCRDHFEIFYDGPLAPEESPVSETSLGPVKMRRVPTRYQFEAPRPNRLQTLKQKRRRKPGEDDAKQQ